MELIFILGAEEGERSWQRQMKHEIKYFCYETSKEGPVHEILTSFNYIYSSTWGISVNNTSEYSKEEAEST